MKVFQDKNGDTSSRIVISFIVIIVDLLIVITSLILQKDIPHNATNLAITITTCVPFSVVSQTYQNIQEIKGKKNV
ncbi:hypothetical protein J5751_04920 [bacterium]|nr:hypothetical protein [bacterium]